MNASGIVAFMLGIRKCVRFQGCKLRVVAYFVTLSAGGEVTLVLCGTDFLSLLRSQFVVVAIAPTAGAIRQVTFQFRGGDFSGLSGRKRRMIARSRTFPAI